MDVFKRKRQEMVKKIRVVYAFKNPDVLDVISKIPRHEFVPIEKRKYSYNDSPVEIGNGQTISQPFTVAEMTHLATEFSIFPPKTDQPRADNLQFSNRSQKQTIKEKKSKVLEIGTGSGYQAAVLSYFFDGVFTIEVTSKLAEKAQRVLRKLNYNNVHLKIGNGEEGWKEKSPFDAIMITAGVEKVPGELFKQLKIGGVLIAPVGKGYDKMMTRFIKLKNKDLNLKPEERKNRGWKKVNIGKYDYLVETFGTFHFVPFIESKN